MKLSVVIAFALGVILDRGKIVEATGRRLRDRVMGEVATLLFLAGFALYLATLYAYDRLLMPTRFWRQKRDAAVARRPLAPRASPKLEQPRALREHDANLEMAVHTCHRPHRRRACTPRDRRRRPNVAARRADPRADSLGADRMDWFFRPMLGSED